MIRRDYFDQDPALDRSPQDWSEQSAELDERAAAPPPGSVFDPAWPVIRAHAAPARPVRFAEPGVDWSYVVLMALVVIAIVVIGAGLAFWLIGGTA